MARLLTSLSCGRLGKRAHPCHGYSRSHARQATTEIATEYPQFDAGVVGRSIFTEVGCLSVSSKVSRRDTGRKGVSPGERERRRETAQWHISSREPRAEGSDKREIIAVAA